MRLTMHLRGEATSPDGAIKVVDLDGAPFWIGRGTDCGWVVADSEGRISRRHCSIALSGGDVLLTDHSTNGTAIGTWAARLNRDHPAPLSGSQAVLIGGSDVWIDVEVEDGATDTAARPADMWGIDEARDLIKDRLRSRKAAALQDPLASLASGADPLGLDDPDLVIGRGAPPPPPRPAAPAPPDPRGRPSGLLEGSLLDDEEEEEEEEAEARPATRTPVSAPPTRTPLAPRPPGPDAFAGPDLDVPDLDDPDFDPFGMDAGDMGAGGTDAGSGPGSPPRPPPASVPAYDDPFAGLHEDATPPAPSPTPAPVPAQPAPAPSEEPAEEHPYTRPASAAPVDALFAGLGIAAESLTEQQRTALLQEVGAGYRAMADTLRVLLAARRDVKIALGLAGTQVELRGNPLKFAADATDSVEALLRPRSSGMLSGRHAVADARGELERHQAAMVRAIRAAISSPLRALDPASLEARLTKKRGIGALVPLGRKAELWDAFVGQHEALSRDIEEELKHVIGDELDRLYAADGSGDENGS